MLESEDLFSLDALLWLESGRRAGAMLGVNQSTMSRRSRDCLKRLGLSLEHCLSAEPRDPMQELLLLERQLHQLHRLRGGAPLRLLANAWVRLHLLEPPPSGWIVPDADLAPPHADPLGLLEARIVDAAVLSGPEVRDLDRRRWRVVDLSALPLQILVPKGHPLVRERTLAGADLAMLAPLAFAPYVPLPVQRTMALLYGQLGAGRGAIDAPASAAAPPALAPCMATPLTRQLWPGHVALDVSLPVPASDHLVVLRELPWAPGFEQVLDHVQRRLQQLRAAVPGFICLMH